MGSTILQICQDAAVGPALNLRRPQTLFSETDEGDTSSAKLLRALTKTVRFLAQKHDWQILRKEYTFSSAGTENEPNGFPSDFLRFIPQTWFNRTRHWKLPDPLSPEEWQARKAVLAVAVIPEIIIAGGVMKFAPQPPTGDTIAYWYIKNAIGTRLAVSPETSRQDITRFQADTDTTFWDDELLILGIEMNYRAGEGLDYAQQKMDFEDCLAGYFTQDGGRKVIDMDGRSSHQSVQDRLAALKSNAVIVTGV